MPAAHPLRSPSWLRALGFAARARLGTFWSWDPSARGLPRGLAAFLLVFAMGMAVVSLVGDQGLVSYWLLQAEEEVLRRDVARLAARETELIQQIEALHSNPSYIEQIARRQLGFVRPGEIIVQLPPKPEEP